MKSFAIDGTLRTDLGKRATRELRNNGQVPCVLYGGETPVHFSVELASVKKFINTADSFCYTLNLSGTSYTAILQDKQFGPVSDLLLHADFLLVKENAPISVSLPIRLIGSPVGVLVKGGVLKKIARRLVIKGQVKDMPQEIAIDITSLDLHQSLRYKDIKIDNVEVVGAPNNLIVAVQPTRNSTDTADATATPGAAAAPAKK